MSKEEFLAKRVKILSEVLFGVYGEIRESQDVFCIIVNTVLTDILNRPSLGLDCRYHLATGELSVSGFKLSGTRDEVRQGESDVHCWVEGESGGEFVACDSLLYPKYASSAGHRLPEPWPRFLWVLCADPQLGLEIGPRDDDFSDALYRWGRKHDRYKPALAAAERRLKFYDFSQPPEPLPEPTPEVSALIQEIENTLNPVVVPVPASRPLPERAIREQIAYCSRRAVEIFKPSDVETYQMCAYRALVFSALASRVTGREYRLTVGAGWGVWTGEQDIWLDLSGYPFQREQGAFHAFSTSNDGAEVIDTSAEFYPTWSGLERLAWHRPDLSDWFWVKAMDAQKMGIQVGTRDEKLSLSIIGQLLKMPEVETMIGASINLFNAWEKTNGKGDRNPAMAGALAGSTGGT